MCLGYELVVPVDLYSRNEIQGLPLDDTVHRYRNSGRPREDHHLCGVPDSGGNVYLGPTQACREAGRGFLAYRASTGGADDDPGGGRSGYLGHGE